MKRWGRRVESGRSGETWWEAGFCARERTTLADCLLPCGDWRVVTGQAWWTAAAEPLPRPANWRCLARPLRRVLGAPLLSSLGCATPAPAACSTGPRYASFGPSVGPIWTRWGVQANRRGVHPGVQHDKGPSLTRLVADSHPMRGGSGHSWTHSLAFQPWVSCALTGSNRRYS